MFNGIVRPWGSCLAITGALLAGPRAVAATPPGFDATPASLVRSLHLSGNELASGTLANIRGGFEVTPSLTINFGFSQIDTIGQKIVQSIIMPITTLTNGQTNVTPQISGGSTTSVQQNGSVISITSEGDQGQTTILTELANDGVTNLIQNQANDKLIQQTTTMYIGVSGMSSWLSQQRDSSGGVDGFVAP
jgi:hypothetical protein